MPIAVAFRRLSRLPLGEKECRRVEYRPAIGRVYLDFVRPRRGPSQERYANAFRPSPRMFSSGKRLDVLPTQSKERQRRR